MGHTVTSEAFTLATIENIWKTSYGRGVPRLHCGNRSECDHPRHIRLTCGHARSSMLTGASWRLAPAISSFVFMESSPSIAAGGT